MKINAIHLISFSPCGHTLEYGRQIAYGLRQCLADTTYNEKDVTPLSAQEQKHSLGEEDLALLCAPVYGGRIPQPAVARLADFAARNTPALLLATYGNRAYDDALLEFVTVAKNQGFWPLGAAACIAQHTLAPECAANRPDETDVESARNFGREMAGIIAANAFQLADMLHVPGNPELRSYTPTPLPQSVNSNCIMCGQCWAHCPTGAITPGFPGQVDKVVCIACMGCINICPTGARIPDPDFLMAVQNKIRPLCAMPRKNEFFTI